MGEVTLNITLTNLIDETHSATVKSVADTGAALSSIPQSLADQLGLNRRRQALARLADGRTQEVEVAMGIIWNIQGRETTDEALILGDQVLIGQTVLEKTHWAVDCHGQKLIPNPDMPEWPVFRV